LLERREKGHKMREECVSATPHPDNISVIMEIRVEDGGTVLEQGVS
jgi:hypothetical protein